MSSRFGRWLWPLFLEAELFGCSLPGGVVIGAAVLGGETLTRGTTRLQASEGRPRPGTSLP